MEQMRVGWGWERNVFLKEFKLYNLNIQEQFCLEIYKNVVIQPIHKSKNKYTIDTFKILNTNMNF